MAKPSNIGARILLVSGLSAFLLSLLLGNGFAAWTATNRASMSLQNPAPKLREALELCRREPSSWVPFTHQRLRVDAYDPKTLAPLSPGGAPPDASLVAAWRAGDAAPSSFGWLWGAGARALREAPEGGRCRLLQAEIGPVGWRTLANQLSALTMAGFVLLGMAVGVSNFFVVRPLLSRLRKARDAARGVGGVAYTSARDEGADALGEISRALDGAHQRLSDDAALLAQRAEALEGHLAELAHDLKTPLSSLQLALERAVMPSDPQEQPRLLGLALSEAVYLGALIENLDLQRRLEAELHAPLVTFDLGALVESLCLRASLLGRARQIEVNCDRPDEPVWVRGDPTLAERALGNLLQNAVAYHRERGHVALSLSREGAAFCLRVLDDGPGVPPEELPRLGERRFRGAAAKRRAPGGSGLGLAITNEAVARLGWTLSFSRQEPSGLCATIHGLRAEPPSCYPTPTGGVCG